MMAGKRGQAGLSIIEVMIALTIGLVLVSSIAGIYVNTARNQKEMSKAVTQIENGRYAIETLSKDIRLAGYYNSYYDLPAVPSTAPNPCELTDTSGIKSATPLHIQAFPSSATAASTLTGKPSFSSFANCSSLLGTANLAAGSDVLVIRRLNTEKLSFGSTPTAGEVYLQTAPFAAEVEIGNSGGAMVSDACMARSTADNRTANDIGMVRKTGNCSGAHPVAADVFKLHTYVYFVAPCSKGTSSATINTISVGGICQSGDDSVPTLKRLELTAQSNKTIMKIVPLVEGVEMLKVEYGLDSSPTVVDDRTNMPGDGEPDEWKANPSVAEMANAVAAKITVLARNPEATPGFVDGKSYVMCTVNSAGSACLASDMVLSSATKAAPSDSYKRHVFTAQVRMDNPSMKREIPR